MEITSSLGLLLEPFYGGSHKVLIDRLNDYFNNQNLPCKVVTLPAKKWHWRARCGALQIYQNVPHVTTEKFLFCSSVLNLGELLGLRPDLQGLRKIVYFHENQLIYPVQEIKARDVQFGYNQILTCLSADIVLFNSCFNKNSFLDNLNKIIKLLPDHKPKNLKQQIEMKSRVIYFPVHFPDRDNMKTLEKLSSVLHIVWPHRWEFDKGPEEFFQVMLKLKRGNYKFKLSVLGETYTDVPEIFEVAKNELENNIINWGFLENKQVYFDVLNTSHVVVSTAKHEFFGVSVLEAAYCGCFPLVPNNLVYPEIYPKPCLYDNMDDLYNILIDLCDKPQKSIHLRNEANIDYKKFSADHVLPKFVDVVKINE